MLFCFFCYLFGGLAWGFWLRKGNKRGGTLRPSTTLKLRTELRPNRAVKKCKENRAAPFAGWPAPGSKKNETRRTQFEGNKAAKQKQITKKIYCYSRAGNRTLVPRVTGEDTSHYTTPEEMKCLLLNPKGFEPLPLS